MASRGINKVILIGNLGADPDIRYMPNGDAVVNVSLATNESWKDRNTGETQERTEWHRVVFFGKLAEIVKQYLHKGSKIYVEGKLRTRKWQGKDGQDRYTTEVVVDFNGTMQMLDGRGGGDSSTSFGDADSSGWQTGDAGAAAPAAGGFAPSGGSQVADGDPQPGAKDDFNDDIPF